MTTQNVTLVAPGTIDQRIITVDTGAGEDAPSVMMPPVLVEQGRAEIKIEARKAYVRAL